MFRRLEIGPATIIGSSEACAIPSRGPNKRHESKSSNQQTWRGSFPKRPRLGPPSVIGKSLINERVKAARLVRGDLYYKTIVYQHRQVRHGIPLNGRCQTVCLFEREPGRTVGPGKRKLLSYQRG